MQAERVLGRRVVDIKRLASLLPKVPACRHREHARPGRRRRRPRRAANHRRVVDARLGGPARAGPASAATSSPGAGAAARAPPTASSRWSGTSRSRSSVRSAGRATPTASAPRAPGEGGGAPAAESDDRPRARDPEAKRKAAELRALGEEVAAAAHGARVRSEGALQGGRDHRPRRVRPRQDRERPALQPARPLPDRRPQVADARLEACEVANRPLARLGRVDLVEEALEQAVDHQVAAGGVVAAGAVAALGLLEARRASRRSASGSRRPCR